MNGSLLDMIDNGGVALWFIVGLSVVALAVALERAVAQWQFTTRARALADTVGRCLGRGAVSEGRSACERSPSPLADVFLVGYERLGRAKPDLVAAAVHRERQRVNQDLRARLWILGTIGATAPFVGLFGTVIGIIDAMQSFKGQKEVPFDQVAAAIAPALIATAAGIFVAVEAVILFNFFNQRAGRVATELKLLTDEFLEQLTEAPAPDETRRSDKSSKTRGEDDGREAA
jgi:biopolymer transport protein ExbB